MAPLQVICLLLVALAAAESGEPSPESKPEGQHRQAKFKRITDIIGSWNRQSARPPTFGFNAKQEPCTGGGCGVITAPICRSSGQCGRNQYCYHGVCKILLDAGQTCRDSGQCSSGSCAASSAGSSGVCDECSGYKQCSRDEMCIRGRCKPPGNNGDTCWLSVECKSGVCSGGRCAECIDGEDCSKGQYCHGGHCRDKLATLERCHKHKQCWSEFCSHGGVCADCHSSDSCHSGQYCLEHRCRPKEAYGQPCRDDDYCLSNKCGDEGKCVLCKRHDNCKPGEFCSARGSCQQRRDVHERCDNNDYCRSQLCGKAGFCVECRSNSDCGPNQRCDWGVCRKRRSFGELCVQDTDCTFDMCRDKKCVQCDEKSDCGEGQFCAEDGRCKDRRDNTRPCTKNRNCKSRQCDEELGQCVECKQHQHCKGKGGKKFCVKNECRNKMPLDFCCRNNNECKSKNCDKSQKYDNCPEGRRGVCV